MNLSRINKIQGLQGRDYEIEYLRLLTGKDLQDVLLTFEDNNPSSLLYEEILLADFQTASAAGTLTAGKTYAITDIVSGIGSCLVLLKAYSGGNEVVANGILIYPSFLEDKVGAWDIQFNIITGVIVSYYNRAYNVRCTTDAVLLSIFTYLSAGLYINCDFSNYTGLLTLDGSGLTRLHNCNFSNSSANFDTSQLIAVATFSGRILHDFVVPDQTLYPCDFTNTIQINADGTNNMMATITLVLGQFRLDFTGFESASTILLVPDAGGNTIDSIIDSVIGREYTIISNDTTGSLNIGTGLNVLIADSINLFYTGLISWGTANSVFNKVYFTYDGINALINNKTSTYA